MATRGHRKNCILRNERFEKRSCSLIAWTCSAYRVTHNFLSKYNPSPQNRQETLPEVRPLEKLFCENRIKNWNLSKLWHLMMAYPKEVYQLPVLVQNVAVRIRWWACRLHQNIYVNIRQGEDIYALWQIPWTIRREILNHTAKLSSLINIPGCKSKPIPSIVAMTRSPWHWMSAQCYHLASKPTESVMSLVTEPFHYLSGVFPLIATSIFFCSWPRSNNRKSNSVERSAPILQGLVFCFARIWLRVYCLAD